MNDLAIIADDLTGAVDAAAPFARDVPVDVFWSRQATGRRYAVSTSSRDVDETLARRQVDAALVDAVSTKLVFKKIDSLLCAETAWSRSHSAALTRRMRRL